MGSLGLDKLDTPGFRRILPFAVYMGFLLVGDLLERIVPPSFAETHLSAVLYPVQILAVVAVLALFWGSYEELRRPALRWGQTAVAAGVGVVVFVLWINMDWGFATMGTPDAYDPRVLPPAGYHAFLAVRIFGAAVVVPVFEELFWRSFILRYIIDPEDFTAVRIGTFTWASCLVSAALFGVEHNLWLAGIAAGLFYNFVLYRGRHLIYPIVAHGVTNLLLGIYVVLTGNWRFW